MCSILGHIHVYCKLSHHSVFRPRVKRLQNAQRAGISRADIKSKSRFVKLYRRLLLLSYNTFTYISDYRRILDW
jgi:hypothetical protein